MGIQNAADCIKYAQMKIGNAEVAREQAPVVRREAAQDVAAQRRRDMQGRKRPAASTQREFNGVSPDRISDEPGSNNKSLGAQFFDSLASN